MIHTLALLVALLVLLGNCNLWGHALRLAVLLPPHPTVTPALQVTKPTDIAPQPLATPMLQATTPASIAAEPLATPVPQATAPASIAVQPLPTPVPSVTVSPTAMSASSRWQLSWSEQAAALLPWARREWTSAAAEWDHLTQYDIDLELDIESLRVSGRERVRYTNREDVPLDEVVFRLFPQTPGYGGEMRVAEVLVDGQRAITWLALEGSALHVVLPRPLPVDQTIGFELAFEVTVPTSADAGYGQLAYINGVLALPEVYPLIPVYDHEGWNVELAPAYGDAVHSDVALYRVQVTAPSEHIVVASGSRVSAVTSAEGRTTTTYVTGPMRDFALVTSADFVTSTTTVDGTMVTSYYLPQDAVGGESALGYGARALGVFNETFGQYPYAEFDLVETPTTAGGIEYPGLVVIAQQLYGQEGGFFEFATVHEAAHQWWYGLVGSDQVDQPWLDEALAQYSTLLYYEQVRGSAVADAIRWRYFERVYADLKEAGRDVPVGQPVAGFSQEDYGPVVYGKGPLLFHALRDELGDELFFGVLRTYLRAYRYEIATPEGFLATAEEVSGRELDHLYEEWITSPAP